MTIGDVSSKVREIWQKFASVCEKVHEISVDIEQILVHVEAIAVFNQSCNSHEIDPVIFKKTFAQA